MDELTRRLQKRQNLELARHAEMVQSDREAAARASKARANAQMFITAMRRHGVQPLQLAYAVATPETRGIFRRTTTYVHRGDFRTLPLHGWLIAAAWSNDEESSPGALVTTTGEGYECHSSSMQPVPGKSHLPHLWVREDARPGDNWLMPLYDLDNVAFLTERLIAGHV
ncbi:hypothetical protein JNJ66_07810 [Candidatus Saccharibacteria bacterium]|nr:hypothetical protein [Candidatus Saccharibacteria bacterium]